MKLQETNPRFETELVDKSKSGPMLSSSIKISGSEGLIHNIVILSEAGHDVITRSNPLYGGRFGEDFFETIALEELGDKLQKSPRRKDNLERKEGERTVAREQLKTEHDKLGSELHSLRRILATHSERPSESVTPLYDDQMAAAEMLAVLEAAQVDLLSELYEAGFVNSRSLVEKLGQQSALEFVSYLANCRAAIVHRDRLLLTNFGRELLRWIESVPGTEAQHAVTTSQG